MEFQKVKIIACEPHKDYKIWILLDDGLSGKIDLSNLVGKGIFAAWHSLDFFNSVYIDKKTDTVAWGNDIDLDLCVLHDKLAMIKDSAGNPYT